MDNATHVDHYSTNFVPLATEATLFDLPNYNIHGSALRFEGTGFHNVPYAFNDMGSSIELPPYWAVMLYEDVNRGGGYKGFNGSVPNFANYTFNNGHPLDNNVSSLELVLGCVPGSPGAAPLCEPTATPTPPPGPTSTPVPGSITVVSAWPQGANFNPGQYFNPDVVIQTNGITLDCGRDFLENRDGNLYGTWPTQGCVSQGNGRYLIHFNTPMRAPDDAGTYHSIWQFWHYPNHIGPQIDLWFRVGQPNHAPPAPTLLRPGDWSEIRSETAPELCWNPVSDPDGDPVQYWVEVYESAVIANSGWIDGTCWRPSALDHQYFGYQWRVRARDSSGAIGDWSATWHFTLAAPPSSSPHPTSTPPPVPTMPVVNGAWWDSSFTYRRPITVTKDQIIATGTMMKVDGVDLESLVAQGKALANYIDVRVVRKLNDTSWQEIARGAYAQYDVEFFLPAPINQAVDTSYFLYYGNPNAGSPPTFELTPGLRVDHHLTKWWDAYHSTWDLTGPIDYSDTCNPPVDHRGHAGSSFDDSDVYWGQIFLPSTGDWTFREYTADGWELTLGGGQVGRYDGYEGNRWVTVGTTNRRAGWYEFEVHDMWVNCNAMRLSMQGPNFSDQVVPASFFRRWWGNLKTGLDGGREERLGEPTPTPIPSSTPITTATPTACSLQFSDVSPDNAFYPFIRCMACRGIISGYGDGTFRPGIDITRGQIAKIVSNAAELNGDAGAQTFEDVPATNPFYLWVDRLSRRGYMAGYPCGTNPQEPCIEPLNRPYFRPANNATRAQLSKIVSNTAGLAGVPTGTLYADVHDNHPFYAWVMRLSQLSVLSGYTCGGPGEPCDDQNRPYFRPNNNVTRGQSSKVVANTFLMDCPTP